MNTTEKRRILQTAPVAIALVLSVAACGSPFKSGASGAPAPSDTSSGAVLSTGATGSNGTGTPGVSVLLQNSASAGTFLAPVTYSTPWGPVDVAVGDLNGDGKPDLVVASIGPAPTGAVSVLLQSSTTAGTFGAATSYFGYGDPLSVAIADLNGDGHPDIAVADGYSATVMLQNAGSLGTFSNPTPVN